MATAAARYQGARRPLLSRSRGHFCLSMSILKIG
jgi:hypothetical protein